MSDKITQTQSPASWDDFPELENFWNAFVDTFWGKGGDTSYHDMLIADQEWLKKAYLQNNDSLTSLEQNYLQSVQNTAQQYESGMEAANVPISFGGQQLMNLVPRSAQRAQDALRGNRKEVADLSLLAGQDQAGRILDYAKQFTPNAPNMAYMDYLGQLGMGGQQVRAGLPSETAKIPSASLPSQISSGIDVAQGAINLTGGITDLFKPQPMLTGGPGGGGWSVTQGPSSWDKLSEFGGDVWDKASEWGGDFWGWLTS